MDKIDYKVTKVNLYEQIADTLEQAIMRSEMKVEKLPSEQELSKRFGVSRTVIREALKVLKERGLIQPRNGEGSYISKPNTDTISSAINRIIRLDNISNDNLHGIRLILETAGGRLAAQYARPGDIGDLERILKDMVDESLPPDKRIRLDAEFHITLARASGNELLRMFVEVMTILLKDYMAKGMSGIRGIKKTLDQHRKILEALRGRNPDEAERAIRDHLIAAKENVNKYEQKKK
jgi:GntR family transcriptional repressor for pyruvate dehydrogenase complex